MDLRDVLVLSLGDADLAPDADPFLLRKGFWNDPDARRFAVINYGPWDRLDGDAPFLEGVGSKPKGANFYPADVTREELEEVVKLGPTYSPVFDVVSRSVPIKVELANTMAAAA